MPGARCDRETSSMRTATYKSAQYTQAARDASSRYLSWLVLVVVGGLASFGGYRVRHSFEAVLTAAHPSASRGPKYLEEAVPPQPDTKWSSIVQRGQRLYRDTGCAECHGREGKGGVANPNSITGTILSLDNMAQKLSLELPEDVEKVIELLGSGISLKDLSRPNEIVFPPELDLPYAEKTAFHYGVIAKIIFEGTQSGKKDKTGPEPIEMPSHKDDLTEWEMNQLIASFLIMYPLDVEAEEESPR